MPKRVLGFSEAASADGRAPEIASGDERRDGSRPSSDRRPSGRALSVARASRPADTVGDALTDEQVAELRARIASGVYRSRAVAEEVARRILESGEL